MAAPPEIVDLGEGSSRSNSPESDAIDIEDVDFELSSNAAKSSSNAQQQQLTSPRSGAGSARMGGLASPSRRSGPAGSATNAKRRMKNQGSEGAANAMSRQIGPEDYEDFGAAAGNFQEAGPGRSTAAAYDRLLDLDYPRNYGDPFARYDAAMRAVQQNQQVAPQAASTTISPTIPTSTNMQPQISGQSTISDASPAPGPSSKEDSETMETDA